VKAYLNYEGRRVEFFLPDSWQLIQVGDRTPVEPCVSEEAEIEEALNRPIRSQRLEDLAKGKSDAIILFDDLQRQTPCHVIIPKVAERLKKGGIREEAVKLLCATGTHPPISLEELKKKVGTEVFTAFEGRIFSHDPFGEHVFVGRTSRGTPIEINRLLHESDLAVGIGTCMPHPSAGFGGGYKIVLPGVASYETTERHHLTWLRNKKSTVNLLAGNPFFEDITEAGRLCGLLYKIDVVIDGGRMVRAFSGDPFFAQREASFLSFRLHGLSIPGLSDITVTSSFPLETGVQAMKALLLASYCTKRGGIIIWLAPHRHAGPIAPLIEEMAMDVTASEYHKRLLAKGIPDYLKHLGVSYAIQVVHFKEICEKFKVIHVTDGLHEEEVRKMGFEYAASIDEAIELASALKRDAHVLVLPSGGSVLPVVKPSQL